MEDGGKPRILFQDETGADGNLPARFAALEPIEADSSLFFGEGKAINADENSMIKALRSWARTVFPQGTIFTNADRGWGVEVTQRSVKHALSHGYSYLLARSVPFIPRIIESGIYLDFIQKKPGLMSHIFANRIRPGGQEYVVGFVLREDTNGNRFYDHELTKIIDPDSLQTDRFPEGSVVHADRANRGSVMTILRESCGVNQRPG